MNIFEPLSSLSSSSRMKSSLPVADFASYALPLPNLFNAGYFDMPINFDAADIVLEEAGDASQPVVYEEVIDFFVDTADPTKVLISRSGAPPASSSVGMSAMAMPVPVMSTSPAHSLAPSCSTDASIARRKRPASPTESVASTTESVVIVGEEKLVMKRERNRQAAERCRARRVNLITSLQAECEQLKVERDQLLHENRILMDALSRADPSSISVGSSSLDN